MVCAKDWQIQLFTQRNQYCVRIFVYAQYCLRAWYVHGRNRAHNLWRPGYWDMKCDRIFLSFWAIFCPFTALTTPKKSKFWKNEKKTPGYIIVHKCTKIIIICYTVPEIWRVTDVIFIFHFRLFFALFLLTTKKFKIFKKMKKMPTDIIICTKNYDHKM